MLFINLASLIDGKILNEPSIASFTNIVFELKNLKTGDLFIGKKSEINQAIEQGAYGIVSTNLKIQDPEIAWIEVESLKNVRQKLLRYFIIKNNLKTLFFDDISYQIIINLVDKNSIIFLDGDSSEILKKIKNSSQNTLLISCSQKVINSLDIQPLKSTYNDNIDVVKYTIFLSTFTYRDNYYKDIKLPMLFLPNLKNVLGLLDTLKITYNLNKLNFINHFKPIFIDSYFKIKPFGQSPKVLILEDDKEILNSSLEYIKKYASWAKTALIVPKEFQKKYNKQQNLYTYKNFSEIKDIDITNYNFLLILDLELKYENYLIKKSNEIRDTLF